MADERERLLSYLGLARRAGKIASGEFQTEEAVKRRRAHLVLVAEDASDNTEKKFSRLCDRRNTKWVRYGSKEELGTAIGCDPRSSLAVLDPGFAAVIEKTLRQKADRERRD